jgi:hypothetical protein
VWRAARAGAEGAHPASARAALELGAAWGWSLVLLMLLGPILLPWYVVWALPLAWILPRAPRAALLGTSTALALSQWTAEPSRFPRAYNLNVLVGHYLITPFVIALLGWVLVDGRRRRRDGAALRDEEPVAEAAGDEDGNRRAGAPRE